MSAGPLLSALRAATSPAHERLHRHPLLCAVQSGQIERSSYALLLGAFWGPWRALEAYLGRGGCPWQVPFRTEELRADLRQLGVAPTPERPEPLADQAAALGFAYTLVGSSAGAPTLRAAVQRAMPGAPLRYLSRSPQESGWPALLCALRSGSPKPATLRVVAAATAAFEWVERGLSGPPAVVSPAPHVARAAGL